MAEIEYRAWDADHTEMRAEGDGMSFVGRAIVYNSPSHPLPFVETIMPGAATRTLKARNDIKALVGHDPTLVIGSTRAGTLKLSEDDRGVLADISLPDNTVGRDLSVSVARRDITSMSFGFSVVKDSWNEDYSERTIHEFRLHEVSVVAMPAYQATSAQVRAMARLAGMVNRDAELLAEAIDALKAGHLDEAQAQLLRDTVAEIAPAVEAEAEAAPEPDTSGLDAVKALLKKADLNDMDI